MFDADKFRNGIRERLRGAFEQGCQKRGFSIDELDAAPTMYSDTLARLEKQKAKLDARIAKEKETLAKKASTQQQQQQQQQQQPQQRIGNVDGGQMLERDNPISVDSMKGIMKFAEPDELAFAIKSLDRSELNIFISGLQQEALEVLSQAVQRASGSDGSPEVSGGENGLEASPEPTNGVDGEEGNLQLADL
jgi:hypothetical protein